MKCILIVLDSVGIGELPDAHKYNDIGSNTLVNTANAVGGLKLDNLDGLGLSNIIQYKGSKVAKEPLASYGRCAEISVGKDTMTGHWEMMGVWVKESFPVYPNGFPREMVDEFQRRTHKKIIGNKPASGTEIIKELGEEHLKTGSLIVYTSADSVLQIAAHKDIISLSELYEICKCAEELFVRKNKVARVIARPFVGQAPSFVRTTERKDYTISPPPNILDNLVASKIPVIGVGKIAQIFAGRSISKEIHGKDNNEILDKTIEEVRNISEGLIFSNFWEFDTLWGHRNNPKGYAKSLEDFDKRLIELTSLMKDDDLLIITADHGCDPTTKGTDHSREYIPVLICGPKIKKGLNLGTRNTFADIGETIAEYFKVDGTSVGESFLGEIKK